MAEWHPETILCGLDGSAQSIRAAQVAASLARMMEGRLIFVTVVHSPEGWWGIVGAPPVGEVVEDTLEKAQREVLDRSLQVVDLEDVDYETVKDTGDPTSQLLAAAERYEADLVILGRRGAGLLQRVAVGSVADRIAHHAECAVLLVP
jgi:nucleotide-binding universal stress UspA family protein